MGHLLLFKRDRSTINQMSTPFTREVISHEEFLRRLETQGVASKHYAFICPVCGTVQSPVSLLNAGVEKERVISYVGFSCVGRWTKAGPALGSKEDNKHGCDWTLGGLFQLHELEVQTKDGKKHMHFRVASPEQAQALKMQHEPIGEIK